MIVGSAGDLLPTFRIGNQRCDPGGKRFGCIPHPYAVTVNESETGAAGRRGDYRSLHRHGFEHLHVRAGRDGGGRQHQIRVHVERADVGDETEHLYAGSGTGSVESVNARQ